MIDSGWGADPRPRQINDRQAKFPTGFQVRWMIDSESPAILVVTVLWAGGDDWISMDDRLGLGQGRKSLAAETRPQGPGSFPPIPQGNSTRRVPGPALVRSTLRMQPAKPRLT